MRIHKNQIVVLLKLIVIQKIKINKLDKWERRNFNTISNNCKLILLYQNYQKYIILNLYIVILSKLKIVFDHVKMIFNHLNINHLNVN